MYEKDEADASQREQWKGENYYHINALNEYCEQELHTL